MSSMTKQTESSTATYAYDAFNRTAKVEKPDGSHIHHEYDPEGLRSGLRENGITSRFVYDGWNMLNELDGDHNVKASYVRGHEWLAQVDGRGDSYYYLNNQHGDVAHITNRLGGIVNSYEYDAFGRTLSATESIPNRFRFAGEQFDHTTEQYYLRARFYNPVIARFTQEDEYRGDGLNLYAYVGNNPINYVDPSGYSSQSVGCGGGGKKEGPYEGTGNGSWKPGMEVTEGHIREAMKNAPLQTQQGAVSLPAINRYTQRLSNGEVPPPIKVDNGIIVDGNHRYISGRVARVDIPVTSYSGGKPDNVVQWKNVKIDPFDWGNK